MRALELLANGDFTVEEIDAMSGPAIGRPKSATFRTADIAGIDILAHVARDLNKRLESEDERRQFEIPSVVEKLIERGWVGEKAGQGFYKKDRTPQGSQILTLDLSTMEYRDRPVAAACITRRRESRRGCPGTPSRTVPRDGSRRRIPARHIG